MHKKIIVKKDHEILSLINEVAFANVPAWYDATRRTLSMSIICPKIKPDHKPMPVIVWICGGAFHVVDFRNLTAIYRRRR